MTIYSADVKWDCYFDFEAPDDLSNAELKEWAEEVAVKKFMESEGELHADDVWEKE